MWEGRSAMGVPIPIEKSIDFGHIKLLKVEP